jgi:hypothetical protein
VGPSKLVRTIEQLPDVYQHLSHHNSLFVDHRNTVNQFVFISNSQCSVVITPFFASEILERNQRQLENSLRNIKEQFENLGDKFTTKAANFSIQNHLKETDCHLRTGDSFRLRSVKFPEYEMGVTSVKLKDEFCYVGLRKVRARAIPAIILYYTTLLRSTFRQSASFNPSNNESQIFLNSFSQYLDRQCEPLQQVRRRMVSTSPIFRESKFFIQ